MRLLALKVGGFLILSLCCLFLSGCLYYYKNDLCEGNNVTQAKIDSLRPYMTKKQVQKVMGTPVLLQSLNLNRWDFIYIFRSRIGGPHVIKLCTLYFVEGRLCYYKGDWTPAHLSYMPQ